MPRPGVNPSSGIAAGDGGQVAQRLRVRLTESIRAEIVRRYEAGATSQVAAASGTSKATVLKVLKETGTGVRPIGDRYATPLAQTL